MKLSFSSLTTKGQITIPVFIREKLNLSTGSKVEFIVHDNHVVIIPINQSVKNLKGILPKPNKILSFDEIDNVIRGFANDRNWYKHFIRFITQDDENQAQPAETLISSYYNTEKSVLINNIVICEIIRVFEKGYGYSKKQIKSALRTILATIEFTFENLEILWLSLEEYEKSNGDFSDILIGNLNLNLGCSSTLTFDKKASNLNSFKFLN